MSKTPLRAGKQPYDALNGARIGGLAGGIVGAAATVVAGSFWPVLAGAGIGAVVGYRYERRRISRDD